MTPGALELQPLYAACLGQKLCCALWEAQALGQVGTVGRVHRTWQMQVVGSTSMRKRLVFWL